MSKSELEKIWRIVRQHLNSAHGLLSPEIANNNSSRLELYNEMLEHNELELALDQLEEIGEENICSREFWMLLKLAASTMGLDNRADYYTQKLTDEMP